MRRGWSSSRRPWGRWREAPMPPPFSPCGKGSSWMPRTRPESRAPTVNMITEGTLNPLDDLDHRSFFFGPAQMSALRNGLPPHQLASSAFKILTACLWRCRTGWRAPTQP
ncbi:hypothetical protein NL676_030243 [Syzygium grande]|nr:hypothetical protein NL676_030243 [Syzygium grande]